MLSIVSMAVVTLISIPSCFQAYVLFGPPSAEQVKVTSSPILTVVFSGDIVTAGDTVYRENNMI